MMHYNAFTQPYITNYNQNYQSYYWGQSIDKLYAKQKKRILFLKKKIVGKDMCTIQYTGTYIDR